MFSSSSIFQQMPAPTVRNDTLPKKREAKERRERTEQSRQNAELRSYCLSRAEEKKQWQAHMKAEEKAQWEIRQQARLEAEAQERELQRLKRGEIVEKIDSARRDRRVEAELLDYKALKNRHNLEAMFMRGEEHRRTQSPVSARMKKAQYQADMERRRREADEECAVEVRKRGVREAEAVVRGAEMHISHERAAKAELEASRRAKVEMSATARRQAERQRMRAKMRSKEADAGWEANLHYLNTHGDKLHWEAPCFHDAADGDGRWPYPLANPQEPIVGGFMYMSRPW